MNQCRGLHDQRLKKPLDLNGKEVKPLNCLELVGASGFEPPTSWSRTIARRGIKHLAGLCCVAPGYAELSRVQPLTALRASSVRNRAQQREAQGGHKSGHSERCDSLQINRRWSSQKYNLPNRQQTTRGRNVA